MPYALKPKCSRPGCPRPKKPGSSMCEQDAAQAERLRGTPEQRGYDREHRRLRAQWALRVEAGLVDCSNPICVMPTRRIQPGSPWHLGHTPDRTGWRGPEHQACNTAEAARKGNARRS